MVSCAHMQLKLKVCLQVRCEVSFKNSFYTPTWEKFHLVSSVVVPYLSKKLREWLESPGMLLRRFIINVRWEFVGDILIYIICSELCVTTFIVSILTLLWQRFLTSPVKMNFLNLLFFYNIMKLVTLNYRLCRFRIMKTFSFLSVFKLLIS